MNRQIKFKGKTTANGHWVYGCLIDYGDNAISISNKRSNPWVQPETIGQFTGLKDRNGKEIYEGDILGIPEDVDFLPETVIFKEGCFMAQDDYTTIAMNSIDTECRTIIGNIHDNPELITNQPTEV